jgi:hypothetical protein
MPLMLLPTSQILEKIRDAGLKETMGDEPGSQKLDNTKKTRENR